MPLLCVVLAAPVVTALRCERAVVLTRGLWAAAFIGERFTAVFAAGGEGPTATGVGEIVG